MMDFVKFAHDRNRMCNVKRGAGEGCKGCPLDEIMDKIQMRSLWTGNRRKIQLLPQLRGQDGRR